MKTKSEPEEKRKPLLADTFIHHRWSPDSLYTRAVGRARTQQLQAKAMKAHRFLFDAEASTRVGDVIRTIPELLVRESQFARAPYPLTWIEIDHTALWRSIYRDNQPMLAKEAPDHAARVAYLVDINDVYIIAGGMACEPDSLHKLHIGPFGYELNTDKLLPSFHQGMLQKSVSEERFLYLITEFFWGSTCYDIDFADLQEITKHFMFYPIFDPNMIARNSERSMMDESVADLRNIIAILLMLNRPAITRYGNEVPRSRGWLRNKSIPFMSHTTVHINIDPVPILRTIGTPAGDGVERRRHEVKGHFCHNRDARDYGGIGCVHEWISCDDDWIPVGPDYPPADVDNWVCAACEGKRWWRATHERGSAAVGFVAKDGYEVERRTP